MNNCKKKSENIFSIIMFAAFAFAILYFCCGSSFRYAINPWVDSNAFFTMGKAMANGMVPYKDIFEQKGPLLYFLHCLAYWISNTSFLGVYIFEAVCATISMIFVYKIANLYLNKAYSYVVSILTFTFVCNSFCFYFGDSAEEFCIPIILVGLYYLIRYFKNSEDFKLSTYFVMGFLSGCVALIKITVIGFWFGLAAMICLHKLFNKDIKKAFIIGAVFLAGMLCAFIPWIIYFAVTGGLKDFINVYFVINFIAYSNNNSFITKVLDMIHFYFIKISIHPFIIILSTISCLFPLIFKWFMEKGFFSRISIPFSFGCLFILTYFSGFQFAYYFLPFTVFICFLLITVFYYLQKISVPDIPKALTRFLGVALAVIIVFCSARFNPISRRTALRGEPIMQKQISEYINSHNPNGTILNYYNLDSGVYLLDNYTNLFKHFEKQNIPYERYRENIDEQNRYIDEHEAYYVVAFSESDDINEIYEKNITLKTDYNLCLSTPYKFVLDNFTSRDITKYCYLFELKDTIVK